MTDVQRLVDLADKWNAASSRESVASTTTERLQRLAEIKAENESIYETFVSLAKSETQWGDGVLYPKDVRFALDSVRWLVAEVERLTAGIDIARTAACQATDYDEDTEAEIALGSRILAAVGEGAPEAEPPAADQSVDLQEKR